MEQYSNSPLITALYHEKIRHLFEPQQKALERAVEEGIIKNLPIEIIQALMHGAMYSFIKFCLSRQEDLPKDVINKSFQAIWDMVQE